MSLGFVVCVLVALCFFGIGMSYLKSEKTVGFFSNVRPPEIREVAKFNRGIAIIWFVSAAFFVLLGVLFLFCKQNSPAFIFMVLGIMAWLIGILIAYFRVEAKYR